MAEVVDSIIAEVILRGVTQYEDGFARMKRAHEGALPSLKALGDQSVNIEQAAQRYKAASNDVAGTEERTTERVTRSRKARTDSTIAADEREVASAKAASKAKVDAEIAEAERSARYRALADRAAARQGIPQADPRTSGIGRTVMRETTGQRPISASALNGGAQAEVEAAKEVDHLATDLITKQAALNTLKGQARRDQQDEIAQLRLQRQLIAQNVSEEETLLAVERLRGAQLARNALADKASVQKTGFAKNAEQFARGAGAYQATGGAFAIAGLAAGAVAGGVAAAAKEGLDYANELKIVSTQLGLTTRDLQVYQTAAEKVGVSTEQLRTAFSDLSNNIGRAKEGAEEQSKIFGKNGLNIDLTKKGYETLSGILPTIVQRFSAIADPAKRAALETALFGESGRKLDSLLSGGNASIQKLGDELERTGGILSGEDIARSAKVAADLKKLGDQLERELASTVSQNAEAIESLATALLKGAKGLLDFISAFQRFRAQAQIASGDPGLAGQGRATLNQTPEGREQALRNNNEALRAIRAGARSSDPFITVGVGRGNIGPLSDAIPNTPEARAAFSRQLRAQNSETIAARNAANALDAPGGAAPQAGSPGNLNVFAPKGPKGPSAATLAKQADEREKRFEDELERSNQDFLAAKRELTVGAEAQLALDQATIESARVRRNADIQREANEKRIDQSKVAELQAANDKAAAEKQAVLTLQNRVRLDEQLFALSQDTYDENIKANTDEMALATTTRQRLRLALQVIQIERDKRADQLNNTINSADPNVTNGQRDLARQQLQGLDAQTDQQRQIARSQNANPLEAYRQRLKSATDDTKASIEQVEVNALGGLENQLSSTIGKVLGLKGAFGELAASIIEDLAKIEIEKAILGATSGGGGGIGGFFKGLLSIGSALGGGGANAAAGVAQTAGTTDLLAGFAEGGSAIIGGNPGIDRNVLSINGVPSLRVGQGEQLTVTPRNIAANNQRVQSADSGNTTVVHAPQFNLAGAVITADLYADMQRISAAGIKAAAPHIARAGAIGAQQVYQTASKLGPVSG